MTDPTDERGWASECQRLTDQVSRLTRGGRALIDGWSEQADALEELSKIENGGDVSETVQGAAAQLRRCAAQLSSLTAPPVDIVTEALTAPAAVESPAVIAAEQPST